MVILAHTPPLNLWSYIWVEEKGGEFPLHRPAPPHYRVPTPHCFLSIFAVEHLLRSYVQSLHPFMSLWKNTCPWTCKSPAAPSLTFCTSKTYPTKPCSILKHQVIPLWQGHPLVLQTMVFKIFSSGFFSMCTGGGMREDIQTLVSSSGANSTMRHPTIMTSCKQNHLPKCLNSQMLPHWQLRALIAEWGLRNATRSLFLLKDSYLKWPQRLLFFWRSPVVLLRKSKAVTTSQGPGNRSKAGYPSNTETGHLHHPPTRGPPKREWTLPRDEDNVHSIVTVISWKRKQNTKLSQNSLENWFISGPAWEMSKMRLGILSFWWENVRNL